VVFRSNHPQKTGTKGQYPKYSQYKRVLMNDFYNCCGYCNDSHYHMGGWKGMQIDHFAPRTPFEDLEHDYDNLVYSCFYCNNAKSNDWVTNDSASPISDNGRRGYINPREEAYSDLFLRGATGSIVPQNDIGLYIYTNLNLGLLRHELIYTIDRIILAVILIDNTTAGNELNQNVIEVLTDNKNKLLSEKFKLELEFRDIIDAR
tara:strand:+ start:1161 stop:1772 length:612 start_codon:yes stop_codon:yes gene_type:complete